MLEVLRFVFENAWHFLGVCVLIVLLTLWKPIEINVLNGIVPTGVEGEKDDNESDA